MNTEGEKGAGFMLFLNMGSIRQAPAERTGSDSRNVQTVTRDTAKANTETGLKLRERHTCNT